MLYVRRFNPIPDGGAGVFHHTHFLWLLTKIQTLCSYVTVTFEHFYEVSYL